MRILYVTPDLGWPLAFGGDIRKWNMLQGLLAAGDVAVAVLLRTGRVLQPEAYAGCSEVRIAHDVHFTAVDQAAYESTFGRGRLTLSRRRPYEYLGGPEENPATFLGDNGRFDLVWFASPRQAVQFAHLCEVPTVLDGDDFAYLREWRVLRAEPWYGAKIWNYANVAKLWRIERTLGARVSCVLRCSDADAARHRAGQVIVVPNGTIVPFDVDRRPRTRVLFVGDLGYLPNRQGIEWFVAHVWPGVRQAVAAAELDLVGRHAPDALGRLQGQSGIRIHGFVPSLTESYSAASVSIAPLQAGGGTRLKILESLAHAVPVVSTRLGAFGLDIPAGAGLVLADTIEAFTARCVEALLGEHDWSSALRGRALVAARYDWAAIQNRVTDIARRVAGTRQFPIDSEKPRRVAAPRDGR